MNLKRYLLLIHLCKGIGITGKFKVFNWVKTRIDWGDNLPSVDEIIKVAGIKQNYQALFCETYVDLVNNPDKLSQITGGEKWISIVDSEYPIWLKEGFMPPIILFYRGEINLLRGRLLGIVGARNATDYSIEILKKLLPGSISETMTIVSGLAKGVDAYAHQCTIANGGKTIGVIGTGLDIYYPFQNKGLQQQIAQDHLLISEYVSGTKGYASHFPERNRIIAGLVQGLLVTEAKQHSGSLITANLALQNNRNVLAVPGRIDSPLSVGTNELILAGAKPILNAKGIIEEYDS